MIISKKHIQYFTPKELAKVRKSKKSKKMEKKSKKQHAKEKSEESQSEEMKTKRNGSVTSKNGRLLLYFSYFFTNPSALADFYSFA